MAATTITETIAYLPPGVRQIYAVQMIADITSPTRAELDAGTDITGEVVDGGLTGFSVTPSTVEKATVGTKLTAKVQGRTTIEDSSLAMYKSEDGNDAYNSNLFVRGENTHVVIFPEGDHDLTPTLHMEVWPVKVQEKALDNDTTKVAQFLVSFATFGLPARDVPVPTGG